MQPHPDIMPDALFHKLAEAAQAHGYFIKRLEVAWVPEFSHYIPEARAIYHKEMVAEMHLDGQGYMR